MSLLCENLGMDFRMGVEDILGIQNGCGTPFRNSERFQNMCALKFPEFISFYRVVCRIFWELVMVWRLESRRMEKKYNTH